MEYSRTPAGWLAGALSLFSDRRDVRSGCYSCGSHSVHGGLLTADRERAAESWDMLRAEAAGALRDDGLVVLARMDASAIQRRHRHPLRCRQLHLGRDVPFDIAETGGFLRCLLHVQLFLRASPVEEPMCVHLRAPGHRRPGHDRAYLRRDDHREPGELSHWLRALLPLAHAVEGVQALPPTSGGGRSQSRKRCRCRADGEGHGVFRFHSVSGVRDGAAPSVTAISALQTPSRDWPSSCSWGSSSS